MAQDAPPRQEAQPLVDLQTQVRPDTRPRLVPFVGPRRQSTTITVGVRTLTMVLLLPLIAVAFADSTLRSPFTAQIVRWCTSSLLVLCALGVVVVGKRPEQNGHRYLLGVAVLLGLSLFEAAPHDTWPRFAAALAALQHYPFFTLVMAATVACGALAVENTHRDRISFTPALMLYLIGVLAALLSSDAAAEHPLTGLLRSLANLGRMLGPMLAVRALLLELSPPDRPIALRFVVTTETRGG